MLGLAACGGAELSGTLVLDSGPSLSLQDAADAGLATDDMGVDAGAVDAGLVDAGASDAGDLDAGSQAPDLPFSFGGGSADLSVNLDATP